MIVAEETAAEIYTKLSKITTQLLRGVAANFIREFEINLANKPSNETKAGYEFYTSISSAINSNMFITGFAVVYLTRRGWQI